MYLFSVCLAILVALFTGLYWWDTRRSFLLELDRVVLWYRLQEQSWLDRKELPKRVDEITERYNLPADVRENLKKGMAEDLAIKEVAGHLAFFDTLKSKGLKNRLKKYEEKQRELVSDYYKSRKKA